MHDIDNELIETRYKGKMEKVTPKEIVAEYPVMKKFFKTVNWWANKTICLKFINNEETEYTKGNRYRIAFFSQSYEYVIDIVGSKKHKNPYIGAVYDCRRHLPLETWTRGGDLTDGYGGEKTLFTIMMEILEREMLSLDVEGYTKENTLTYKK